MDMQSLQVVVGAILAVIGSINAFFIKGLMNSINDVRIDLVRTITRHDSTIEGVAENKSDIKDLDNRVNLLERN